MPHIDKISEKTTNEKKIGEANFTGKINPDTSVHGGKVLLFLRKADICGESLVGATLI